MNTSRFRLRGCFTRSGWIALLLIAGLPAVMKAQGITSSGTDFWAGFFPDAAGRGFLDTRNTELFLASTSADTAIVTYDGTTTAWPIAANSVISIDLNARGVTELAETPLDRSVHIQTRSPISVYGLDNAYTAIGGSGAGAPDGFLGLPTSSLGSEYYTINYTEFLNFAGMESAEFLIIAPYDSTLVTITPTAHTQDGSGALSHVPGQTWSVMLMKGQSYLVKSSGQFSGIDDLTGSHVTSSKPVALLSGHQMADIPDTMPSADYLIEMEPPSNLWGTEYFEIPMAGRTICGDYIRILSAENGNIITANGTPVATLNAGQWMEINTVTTPQFYQSSNGKRFLVAEYSYSGHYLGDTVQADPFMVLLVGREQFEKQTLFRTPDPAHTTSYSNYVTILAPALAMSGIIINGIPATSYPKAGQATFPGTPIVALRIILPNGSHSYNAVSNIPFGMYQYGINNYEGYGWPAGLSLSTRSSDTLPPAATFSKTCHNYTVTIAETRTPPAYPFADSRIADVTMITQTGDPRWPKASYNYMFTLDLAFRPGDSIAHFSLAIIDPTKQAYAAVYAVDFNGNDTVYEFSSSVLVDHAYQHLAIRSGSIGQQVTMPLQEDIGDNAFLATFWSNLKSLTATFSFDASRLQFLSLNPPPGWTLGPVTKTGNSVTYTINNVSSLPAQPLDMGSAVFRVLDTLPGMALVALNDLQLYVGLADEGICLSTSEDAMWGIEIMPGKAGVSSVPPRQPIAIRPNPFDDRILIDDPDGTLTSVEIFDALGRVMISAVGGNLSDVQTSSLMPGTYVIVCHTRSGLQTFHMSKPR